MEALVTGTLLETTCDTVCWRSGHYRDFHVPSGQALLFLSTRKLSKNFQNLSVARVIHPKHGRVECLACDLKMIENT